MNPELNELAEWLDNYACEMVCCGFEHKLHDAATMLHRLSMALRVMKTDDALVAGTPVEKLRERFKANNRIIAEAQIIPRRAASAS